MSLFSKIFGLGARLDANAATRLARWRDIKHAALTDSYESGRYVVVDVESTGLDLNKDRLIAIGAVVVEGGKVSLRESFEIVLRQDRVSTKDNILIHGIGGEAQSEGVDPVQGLLDFLEFLGKAPLVAYHVTFDQTMIRRALKEYLGLDFKHPWLDLAYIMPGLLPEYARRYRALDDWSGHFNINNYARHSALADALATAQLMLVALPLARAKNSISYKNLQDLEQAQRWVSWGR
jgi:DNA polymerase-3 subunit epsilon